MNILNTIAFASKLVGCQFDESIPDRVGIIRAWQIAYVVLKPESPLRTFKKTASYCTVSGMEVDLPAGTLRIGRMRMHNGYKLASPAYIGWANEWVWTARIGEFGMSYRSA